MRSILHIGLDVDDKNFHGGCFCLDTGEIFEFKTKATLGALVKKIIDFKKKGYEVKVCYESSYIGYNLCRDLNKQKIFCEIIALSLIPERPRKRIKTDRLDALDLAKYYAKDLLTSIYIPDKTDEAVRDLIRTRSFLVTERKRIKMHILSTCRRYNIDYKQEKKQRIIGQKRI
jgi:transposase